MSLHCFLAQRFWVGFTRFVPYAFNKLRFLNQMSFLMETRKQIKLTVYNVNKRSLQPNTKKIADDGTGRTTYIWSSIGERPQPSWDQIVEDSQYFRTKNHVSHKSIWIMSFSWAGSIKLWLDCKEFIAFFNQNVMFCIEMDSVRCFPLKNPQE